MIIIEKKDSANYPTIWKHLNEYKLQTYLESLYDSISHQMEIKRYYQMKFQNIKLPNIKKEDVLNEMEKTLLEQPKIFAHDMHLFCN